MGKPQYPADQFEDDVLVGALRRLLACPALNEDAMERETRDAIGAAEAALATAVATEEHEDDDDGYPPRCSNAAGHCWPAVEEHERSLCVHCGADGDA